MFLQFLYYTSDKTATVLDSTISVSHGEFYTYTYIHSCICTHTVSYTILYIPSYFHLPCHIHGKKRRSHGRETERRSRSTIKSIWKVTRCTHFRSLKVLHTNGSTYLQKTSFFYFNTHFSELKVLYTYICDKIISK